MVLAQAAPADIWPLAAYFVLALVVAAVMILLSHVLGERHHERATGQPYESGIVGTGEARTRLSINFYMVAMFFVIFDVESAFIFAWAVALREAGWLGFIEAVVFISILAAALAYLWRLGALDWGTSKGRRQRTR